jgi:hypothetical protein
VIKRVTLSDKDHEVSFKVPELFVKNMISQIISKKLIGPACLAIVETILDNESRDFIYKVLLFNNNISRRII